MTGIYPQLKKRRNRLSKAFFNPCFRWSTDHQHISSWKLMNPWSIYFSFSFETCLSSVPNLWMIYLLDPSLTYISFVWNKYTACNKIWDQSQSPHFVFICFIRVYYKFHFDSTWNNIIIKFFNKHNNSTLWPLQFKIGNQQQQFDFSKSIIVVTFFLATDLRERHQVVALSEHCQNPDPPMLRSGDELWQLDPGWT